MFYCQTRVWILTTLITCVIVSKLLNLSESQFLQLENGADDYFFSGLLRKLETLFQKYMDSYRPSLNGSYQYYNYFSYTWWYFKENILASLQPPVQLKITGVLTQGGDSFVGLEPRCKNTGFSFWQAALWPNPKTAPTQLSYTVFNYFLKCIPFDLNTFALVKPLLLQLQPWVANANPNLLSSSYFPLEIQKGSCFRFFFLITIENLTFISQ